MPVIPLAGGHAEGDVGDQRGTELEARLVLAEQIFPALLLGDVVKDNDAAAVLSYGHDVSSERVVGSDSFRLTKRES